MTLFAGVALALAVVGVYGVLSYSVAGRNQEIGVRMALGARRIDVIGLVLRQSLALVGLGTLVGVLSAYGLTRFLSSLLFGISPHDPWVYATSSVALLLVAIGASWLPARRAASVDPNSALKSL
jgi:putative ABC transport system permease protein